MLYSEYLQVDAVRNQLRLNFYCPELKSLMCRIQATQSLPK